jgi:tRNA threonylcarbamoyladenosine biosynthesis protein TsaB
MVSAAVMEDRRILGEAGFNTRQGHMERLLPVIDQILSGLGITLQDIDAFAVAVGPGSFTSLRVGLATAKAFAHATRKPLTGVPTLDVLAQGLHGTPGLICPVLTARAQEVYASFYVSEGQGMKRLSGYLALDPQRLADRLQNELRAGITFTGEGALAWWDVLQDALGDRAVLAEPAQLWPRAALVASLGLNDLERRQGEAGPSAVQALYVKLPAIRPNSNVAKRSLN